VKCQSCRITDPTVERRYYGRTLCQTCAEAHGITHTSVRDGVMEVRGCTDLRALRKALYTERRTCKRRVLVTAIERRIRKLEKEARRA